MSDQVTIPSFEAFSETTITLGNEAFGALVRAALWRASHGWKSGRHVVWEVPLKVAHTIAPEAVWSAIRDAGAAALDGDTYVITQDLWGVAQEVNGEWRVSFSEAEDERAEGAPEP